MLEYAVARDGSTRFCTVGEALEATPFDEPVLIRVAAGEYREKVFCHKRSVAIRGAGRGRTRIVWGDGALDPLPDGKRGTFRSYTAFFDGDWLCLRDLTIENDAGDGESRGQAVAAALHARRVLCENVAFLGFQDTLFCAPLPEAERQPRGFLGPREHAPRLATTQLFLRCAVSGTVDFIFGGANALFEDCELICRNRPPELPGYVAAPCTPRGELGMVFLNCRIHGEAGGAVGGYALARPWREHGRAAFVRCHLGDCVGPDGFAPWSGGALPPTVGFAEAENTGPGARDRRRFGNRLSAGELDALLERVRALRAEAEEPLLGG